mmetsp:Transcript_45407/g.114287  ORF Transcript_45407/g.114287 Transcript_45407/m.114287 type:complete len:391 (+) Transcript_45407:104-1276(+)|eukprot:CAMPEP_0177640302 /NCGR_PEP_ID=MMETSP0447-20121125/6472_1 /TAXON_ID=0 /ORGANISM="Stygamoeba regulata, Strain BSH-02190019" /LENGTH=390 /DNA_ID=CAMNT_0019142367 /DNA_START=71 /DNA_END=1243 /DNA_ORIENTATION=-
MNVSEDSSSSAAPGADGDISLVRSLERANQQMEQLQKELLALQMLPGVPRSTAYANVQRLASSLQTELFQDLQQIRTHATSASSSTPPSIGSGSSRELSVHAVLNDDVAPSFSAPSSGSTFFSSPSVAAQSSSALPSHSSTMASLSTASSFAFSSSTAGTDSLSSAARTAAHRPFAMRAASTDCASTAAASTLFHKLRSRSQTADAENTGRPPNFTVELSPLSFSSPAGVESYHLQQTQSPSMPSLISHPVQGTGWPVTTGSRPNLGRYRSSAITAGSPSSDTGTHPYTWGRAAAGPPQSVGALSPSLAMPQVPGHNHTSSLGRTARHQRDPVELHFEMETPVTMAAKGGKKGHCRQCGTTESPEWRRGPHGPKTLCNACGIQYGLQQRD